MWATKKRVISKGVKNNFRVTSDGFTTPVHTMRFLSFSEPGHEVVLFLNYLARQNIILGASLACH